ncbi:hypothetical protein CPC08DRAFT_770708 [Agrocybe pediades]|nr:hypothetical protein CPC08DRAFT_770708 [Agrocybe pediades]
MSNVSSGFPIFCLTIGINHYVAGHEDFPNLAGAVLDANNFDKFLKTELGVPEKNILSLRDQTATREGMFLGFTWLLDQVMARLGNAYAIIFFSGHGAWDTTCAGSMLCPSDIGKQVVVEGGRTKIVEGISSSTISKCLRKLNAAGVLKVTVVADCCMASRLVSLGVSESMRHPSTTLPVPFHNALGVLPRSIPRFTLFASSGRSALSYEDQNGRGARFVNQFLSVLQQEHFKNFTDISLMHRLAVPNQPGSRQVPHCISSRMYGTPFIGHGDEGSSSFAFTAMEGGQCSITVRAGSAEGIRVGAIWSIHKTNLADSKENPALGQLEVIKVDLFSSTVRIPRLPSAFPVTAGSIFYSKLVQNASSSIAVYSSSRAWLESVIPPAVQRELSIRIVDNVEESDLVLSVVLGRVRFQRRNQLGTLYSEPVMRDSVDAEDVRAIHNVVKSSIHFDYHLKRHSPYKFRDVRMELKEVVEEELEDGDKIFRPKGKNLLDQGSATIRVDEEKQFGVTLHNDSKIPFYPYLFYFDPSQLTIGDTLLPSSGGRWRRWLYKPC